MKKGLRCFIYKHRGQSLDGVSKFSSRFDEVTLLPSRSFPNIPEIFDAAETAPAVVIKVNSVFGKSCQQAFRADDNGNALPGSFGGCFIHSSDSRFPSEHPVMLMDRTEILFNCDGDGSNE
jgi:hypothetical protein